MNLSKKALPRRTLLRGAGAALALPLLDAMIPAATAAEKLNIPGYDLGGVSLIALFVFPRASLQAPLEEDLPSFGQKL